MGGGVGGYLFFGGLGRPHSSQTGPGRQLIIAQISMADMKMNLKLHYARIEANSLQSERTPMVPV